MSPQGLDIALNHLAVYGRTEENALMIERLQNSMAAGERVSGADANFYLHEVSEATMVKQGMAQPDAHPAAFEKYRVSPYSVILRSSTRSVGRLTITGEGFGDYHRFK